MTFAAWLAGRRREASSRGIALIGGTAKVLLALAGTQARASRGLG